MKSKNLLLLGGIGALILIILNWDKLMAFAKGSSTATAGNNNAVSGSSSTVITSSPGSSSTGPVSQKANPTELLRKGSKGASVLSLQQMIVDGWGSAYLPKYGVDGDFGSETEAALKAITGGTSTTLTTFKMNYYDKQKAGGTPASTGNVNTTSPWWFLGM